MKHVKQSRGFSLIEIMVVLVIMGLLASVVAPNVMEALSGSKKQKVEADFANIETALKMYKLDNFIYPTTEQGLEALVSPPTSSPEAKTGVKAGTWVNYLTALGKPLICTRATLVLASPTRFTPWAPMVYAVVMTKQLTSVTGRSPVAMVSRQ